MLIPLRYKLTLEVWGIALSCFVSAVIVFYVLRHVIGFPLSFVLFLLGMTTGVLFGAMVLACFDIVRSRHVWRMGDWERIRSMAGQGFRLGVVGALALFPVYFIFGTFWDFFHKHYMLQGTVFAVLSVLSTLSWLWLTKRLFHPFINQQPPDPSQTYPENHIIFRNAMQLLGLAALGGFCLCSGVYLLITGKWYLGIALIALTIGLLFIADRQAQTVIRRLSLTD